MLFTTVSPQGEIGLHHDKYKPPPENDGAYIEQNIRNAAIPNKGIAAFFYSTGFYTFTYIMAYIARAINLHFPAFVQESVFLLKKLISKLCPSISRCRSPPTPFDFEHISKIERRKGQ